MVSHPFTPSRSVFLSPVGSHSPLVSPTIIILLLFTFQPRHSGFIILIVQFPVSLTSFSPFNISAQRTQLCFNQTIHVLESSGGCVKTRVLGPTPKLSDLVVLGLGLNVSISIKFQCLLMLLQGLHFESHCYNMNTESFCIY